MNPEIAEVAEAPDPLLSTPEAENVRADAAAGILGDDSLLGPALGTTTSFSNSNSFFHISIFPFDLAPQFYRAMDSLYEFESISAYIYIYIYHLSLLDFSMLTFHFMFWVI